MNTITAISIGLVFVTIVISAFYQYAVRPVLLRSLTHRVFAKRDALRRMAIEGKVSASSMEFNYLQGFLCKTIALFPNLSLLRFCSYAARGSKPNVEMEYFNENAPQGLVKLRREAVEDVLAILVLNSPAIALVGLVVMMFLWVIGKVRSSKIFQATEGFVFYFDPDPALI